MFKIQLTLVPRAVAFPADTRESSYKQLSSDAIRFMNIAESITNFATSAQHLLTWSLTSTCMPVQGYGISLPGECGVTSLRRPSAK